MLTTYVRNSITTDKYLTAIKGLPDRNLLTLACELSQ